MPTEHECVTILPRILNPLQQGMFQPFREFIFQQRKLFFYDIWVPKTIQSLNLHLPQKFTFITEWG
jgi:hypothetical protein